MHHIHQSCPRADRARTLRSVTPVCCEPSPYVNAVPESTQGSSMDLIQEWAALIGRRNIAYVVFVSLLAPFGMLMEAAGTQGPDSGGGIMAAIILWGVVSLIFFIANAGLLISSLARGRSAMKPLIACALPIVCVVLPLVLEPFFVR
jgi:hypothetical protein